MNQAEIDRRVARYRAGLESAGNGPKDVERAVASVRLELESVLSRKCPECGANLEVKVDQRQAGPCEIAGVWFNAKCSRCLVRFDFIEEG